MNRKVGLVPRSIVFSFALVFSILAIAPLAFSIYVIVSLALGGGGDEPPSLGLVLIVVFLMALFASGFALVASSLWKALRHM